MKHTNINQLTTRRVFLDKHCGLIQVPTKSLSTDGVVHSFDQRLAQSNEFGRQGNEYGITRATIEELQQPEKTALPENQPPKRDLAPTEQHAKPLTYYHFAAACLGYFEYMRRLPPVLDRSQEIIGFRVNKSLPDSWCCGSVRFGQLVRSCRWLSSAS